MNILHALDKARHGPRCRIGGSKSQDTRSTSNNYDNRSIVTTTLDGGAIKDAFDFASLVGGGAIGAVTTVAGAALQRNEDLASQSISASGAATAHAYEYADNLFGGAIGFAAQNATGTANAYDHAAQIQGDAYRGALSFATATDARAANSVSDAFSEALGFAKSSATQTQNAYNAAASTEAAALGVVQNAYADAKGTTQAQQKMILAVLALAGVALMMKGK